MTLTTFYLLLIPMIGTIPMMDIFSLWKFKICHFIQSKSAPAIRYRDYRRLDIDVIVAQKGVVVGKEGGIRVPFIVGGGRQKREGNHAVGCSLLLFCISVQIHKYTKNINVQIHKCTNAQIHKTMLWGMGCILLFCFYRTHVHMGSDHWVATSLCHYNTFLTLDDPSWRS